MKLNIQDIDWNSMWKDAIEESNWKQRAGTPEFRDGRVDWFEELVRQSDRAGMIMKRIEAKPDYTVLGIVAGPGTVTIPLARIVKGRDCYRALQRHACTLEGECIKAQSDEHNCIPKRWEDVEIREDIEKQGGHDVVIASHSLAMKDVQSALSKMNDAVKRRIYMFIVAGLRRETTKNSLWALFNKEKPGWLSLAEA
jgi:hypothetical protein